MESVCYRALLTHIYPIAGVILGDDRQPSCLSKAGQPVAQEHHRRAGGAAFAKGAVRAECVQRKQHNISDQLRRDLLPLKEEAHRIKHRGRAAVIIGNLITQRALHQSCFSINACASRAALHSSSTVVYSFTAWQLFIAVATTKPCMPCADRILQSLPP